MQHRFQCAAAAIILLGAMVPCAAQITPAPRTPACADDQRPRAGATAPQPSDRGNQNLSDKLAQTDGILCPPDVDPEIKAPTPQGGGAMPVIPPPGSPGGDPTVRPK
jgi:hypothetical protein